MDLPEEPKQENISPQKIPDLPSIRILEFRDFDGGVAYSEYVTHIVCLLDLLRSASFLCSPIFISSLSQAPPLHL